MASSVDSSSSLEEEMVKAVSVFALVLTCLEAPQPSTLVHEKIATPKGSIAMAAAA